jgi:SAM-dependent methyltransferase
LKNAGFGDGLYGFIYSLSSPIDIEEHGISVLASEARTPIQFLGPPRLGLTADNNYYRVPMVDGKRVLEIGCNIGLLAAHIINNRKAAFYCGIDPWRGEEQTPELRPRWRFGDVERRETLPFDEKWDVVVCFDVLYHLISPLQALRNLHDLAGEMLVLGTTIVPEGDCNSSPRHPIGPHVMRGPVMRFEPNYNGDPTNYFYPTESCLVSMLKWVGFKRIERKYYYYESGNGFFCDRGCYHCWK